MPIRTVIVDDEQLACEELSFLLSACPDVVVVGQGRNGLEAVEMIETLSPDLVLLDVQMPGLDGFQVVEELMADGDLPYIVFVTAYDEYALRAFEVNATDYLLKPVDRDRLEVAIQRVKRRLESSSEVGPQIERLLSTLSARSSPYLTRLSVRKDRRLLLIDTASIIYAHILDGVITVVTEAVEGMTNYRTLDEMEADLDPKVFWRVHRGHLVNIHHVAEIIPWFSGTYRLRLDDKAKTEVPLSRAQARRLRKVLRW